MKKSNYSAVILILLLSQKLFGAPTELQGIWEGTIYNNFFGISYTSREGHSPLSNQPECILQINNQKLFLKIPLNQPLYDLKIVTTQGKVIYRKSFISGNRLSGTFSPGVYLLSVKSSSGQTVTRMFRIGG